MVATAALQDVREIRHGHLFCGIGAGAKGFNRGHARVGNMVAKFRCVGGIDVDRAACKDFERIAKGRATCLDLFSRAQYRAFHGTEPPAGWRESTPVDIREAFDERPHIVFLSAPCKGFSGLLAEKVSLTAKYQALNGLTLRGIEQLLEAFADDPVELIVFENVPRIATRGRALLDQIIARLVRGGYAVAESTHDCGELGKLGQSRKRFLLVARYKDKIPPHLHEPEKHRLRGVGEILDQLPLPLSVGRDGKPLGGAMHRVPALQWQTWVRLGFVRAGADWRSLNELAVENGVLRDFGIVPLGGLTGPVIDPRYLDANYHSDVLGVREWGEPTGTVPGRSSATNGAHSIADPRTGFGMSTHHNVLKVTEYDGPAGVISGANHPSGGALSVADPRVQTEHDFHGLRVNGYDETANAITTQRSPGSSAQSVADPRITAEHHNSALGVAAWETATGTVRGASLPTNGQFAVADPRPPDGGHGGKYRVTARDEPAGAVISASTTGNGAFAVADPHVDGHPKSVQLGVLPWGPGPSGVITGSMAAGGGPNSIADPRINGRPRFNNVFRIVGWGETASAVAGPGGAGGPAVQDIRYGWHPGASSSKLRVTPWVGTARPVTGAQQVASGAGAVADPRPAALSDPQREVYLTGGHYGITEWGAPAGAVPAHAKNNNGPWSVADPRVGPEEPGDDEQPLSLPGPKERLVCVIIARDGTWHRPFTTLELAALQGLVDPGEMFELDGLSDSAWRERIGNCGPPPSAEAIASVMGETLLLAWAGVTFRLSNTPIWVRNVAVALSIAPQELPGT
jgi:site-specific DNA-cytosine methylase